VAPRRQVDRGVDGALELGAALLERQVEEHLVVAGEDVEGDEPRGRLLGEHVDARLGRVDALAERVEELHAVLAEDDDLAVEHVAPGREAQLGEVPRQRLAVARLQVGLVAVDERHAAEAVPLRLVRPALALGQLRARARELGQERRCDGEGHRARRL
jgi:hypothetical protein